MHIIQIEYAELRNTGNYEHIKLAVTVAVAEGEDPNLALKKAKDWVKRQIKIDRMEVPSYSEFIDAKRILALAESPDESIHPDHFKIQTAKEKIASYEEFQNELPF